MNSIQRKLLYIFLPMTLVIVLLDNLFPGDAFVNYVKYATIIALFLFTLCIKKRHIEQLYMNIAIFFIVVADFFLVFCDTIPGIGDKLVILGVLAFLFAYIFLILAFQKNFKVGGWELLAALLVLILFVPNYITLWPHVTGLMFYGGTLFGIVLCYMAWTCICTLFKYHYRFGVACRIALAGCLMLISDIGVSQSFFNPAFQHRFNPGLASLIWATYVPAWTLIATIIAENNLLANHLFPN
ncbi:lysoplasmalogenase family protein [Desulfotruncus alcoholivorax]|uniref:lysoplasmalogenase family protein n=1 Tax=Desulfotruncus alcoholivorax TaxID=265477 RepID=UPI0003F74500|nr:lysoplasmalogenase family protein [Desulfotruncus alcoholivorax]